MDVAYQYLTFFMEDDERLAQIKKVCYNYCSSMDIQQHYALCTHILSSYEYRVVR